MTRFWVVGVVAAVSMASTARAQESRFFQDSWFWGVHLGTTTVGTAAQGSNAATTVGAEWMITRTSGALYVGYDHANFARTARVEDASASGGMRDVAIEGMHTVSLGAVAFPERLRFAAVRPYGGLGFALSIVGSATAQADVPTTPGATPAPVSSDVERRVTDAKSRTTVFALGGAQVQVRRTAVFAQVSAMPSSSAFLVTRPVTMVTVGARCNFGPSVER